MNRDGLIAASGVAPYALQRALGDVLSLLPLDCGNQRQKVGMHRKGLAKTRLDLFAQGGDLWNIAFNTHCSAKIIHYL